MQIPEDIMKMDSSGLWQENSLMIKTGLRAVRERDIENEINDYLDKWVKLAEQVPDGLKGNIFGFKLIIPDKDMG